MDCFNLLWLDEVWRWPLAWPVTVGGVFALPKFWAHPPVWCSKLRDSKQLSVWQREILSVEILSDDRILTSIHSSSAKIVDEYWIIEALHRASIRVIDDILRQLQALWSAKVVDIVVDGNHEFWLRELLYRRDGVLRRLAAKPYRQQINSLDTLIKWDDKLWQISAASIIAKTHRDEYMRALSKKKPYKIYGFDRHKWYGTKHHRAMIARHGASDIHRSTYLHHGSFPIVEGGLQDIR